MTDSDFTYLYEVGKIRGTVFQLAARHTPSTNNVESFAVILFFELADGTRVEVAKVDDTEHAEGDIHIDQYYRETGADHKDFTVDISDCWEAEQHLNDHWKHVGRTYLSNHGRSLRDDGVN